MNSLAQTAIRDELLNIFSCALNVVNGRRCVANLLSHQAKPRRPRRVIAIGKAAASMMQGVLDVEDLAVDAGLVITKSGHTLDFSAARFSVTQYESAHPYPDARSLTAGRLLLAFIEQSPADAELLFLISGGTSSLVEVLAEGVSSEQLHEFNRWLLAQGWPIHIMNRVRQSISLIKGGRLATRLAGRSVQQLLISDVPNDDPAVIGSGLLVAAPYDDLPGGLPEWLSQMQAAIPVPPAVTAECLAGIKTCLVASNAQLRDAVEAEAKARDLRVQHKGFIDGDAEAQGRVIAQQLLEGLPGIYIWGGECVLRLPENPGHGGRCQHLALSAARTLTGSQHIALLAVGTDGTDGPGDVAGALVDGGSLQRGRDGGASDVIEVLKRADSGRFLAASGDLIDTGPTGTNVMDLILGLKI